MSRYFSYLNTAVSLIRNYKGQEPLANHLKKFFSENKKIGSTDRKQISHLCYSYFRLGKALPGAAIEERIVAGLFMCSVEPNELLHHLRPEWNEKATADLTEKINILTSPLFFQDLFPFTQFLSEGIDTAAFAQSFLQQPNLFLRVRPGYLETVNKKLVAAGLAFMQEGNCIILPNNSKVEHVVAMNKEVVIQDYNSQQVGQFLSVIRQFIPNTKLRVWDCCAASGGKSILAVDILGDIALAVSDIRDSILFNLKKRLAEAGIKNYHSFTADLSVKNNTLPGSTYDVIIADVPCSGSGTWSRTPEQLYFFDTEKIFYYSRLQKEIIVNIVDKLKPGGFLLYITCSVFKNENEEMTDYIQQQFKFQLIQQEVMIGYDKKADTMFAALFKKPL